MCMLRILGILKPSVQVLPDWDAFAALAHLDSAALIAMIAGRVQLGPVPVFSVCCTCLGKCLCARLCV